MQYVCTGVQVDAARGTGSVELHAAKTTARHKTYVLARTAQDVFSVVLKIFHYVFNDRVCIVTRVS